MKAGDPAGVPLPARMHRRSYGFSAAGLLPAPWVRSQGSAARKCVA
jgi:hypothetical protein